MTSSFDQFIEDGKVLAGRHGLSWDVPYDPHTGAIPKAHWWDLGAAAGKVERSRKLISTFAANSAAVAAVCSVTGRDHADVMMPAWISFLKATAVHDLFVKGRTPGNFATNISDSLRILAICAGDTPPPLLSASIVSTAYNAALIATPSAKRASTLKALIANWLDGTGIAEQRPLAQYCTPDPSNALSLEREERIQITRRRQVDNKRPDALRSDLSQVHYAEKLPNEAALAELIRIVFSARPDTFTDLIRFHQARILLATGFRVGELVSLPSNCLIVEQPAPTNPRLFGPLTPIVMLRNFAEKQMPAGRGVELMEAIQHVPPLLVPTVMSSVGTVLRATEPLRRLAKAQRETGSLFPDLRPQALISWTEAYTRASGVMQVTVSEIPQSLKDAYRETYDVVTLNAIRQHQARALMSSSVSPRVRDYFRRVENNREGRSILRDSEGSELVLANQERLAGRAPFVRVGELEEYIREHLKTKLPEQRLSRSDCGEVGLEDRLFLIPGRALAEAKHDAIIDIERYFSVQSASAQDLELQLGGTKGGRLFQRYGASEKERCHTINPHSLRHLQNTELFSRGVADTVISRRYNRKGVDQSYVYDHRTLAEHLDEMEPETARLAKSMLGPKARQAFDLIRGGKITGPVVSRFQRVQREEGDEAAFEFLNAEAGALHFTPYGFCLNSFAASPCVKHLECFNRCSHLVRTDAPEEQMNLIELSRKYEIHIERLRAQPSKAPNYFTQLAHAEERLAGVQAALAQAPGQPVFANGQNLYEEVGRAR
ncbi:hypothetical protein [Brevundimonas diminuta]|uniref:hypothetical protein n=1 Tax=Brevundimonas diminuta TaxID=293 RepID=UPI001904C035|nr:hypothetical protein [Brevundimonas diminuta]MBK1967736.1 hypothetical protein [Brevundimonas diminuta]MBN9480939.1 hypothetical protein [Bordetella sp.]MDA0742338.1 hypothetical protein [Pseudomonadota bacterium]MDA1235998.1 hypothetical protein [Acidobacteriota bacterium]